MDTIDYLLVIRVNYNLFNFWCSQSRFSVILQNYYFNFCSSQNSFLSINFYSLLATFGIDFSVFIKQLKVGIVLATISTIINYNNIIKHS